VVKLIRAMIAQQEMDDPAVAGQEIGCGIWGMVLHPVTRTVALLPVLVLQLADEPAGLFSIFLRPEDPCGLEPGFADACETAGQGKIAVDVKSGRALSADSASRR